MTIEISGDKRTAMMDMGGKPTMGAMASAIGHSQILVKSESKSYSYPYLMLNFNEHQ